MKKRFLALILTSIFTISSGMSAFAGEWRQAENKWWYDNGNGTWPSNTWQWVDGKCYYFDSQGYMLFNTVTPDGYTVNELGQWTINGIVQTQQGAATQESQNTQLGWQKDTASGQWRYRIKEGYVTSQWRKIDGKKYFFDDNSSMVTGFWEINGSQYYFLPDGALQTKTFLQDGIYYVVDRDTGAITDEVDQSEWRQYKKDNNIKSKDIASGSESNQETSSSSDSSQTSQLSDAEVTKKILALKSSYPEGKKWTNSNTFRRGNTIGGGCAGFAFIVQNAVYGKDQEYRIVNELDWDSLRPGDHIRMDNNAGSEHSVIILEKKDDYIKVTEGNYNSSIHWGRKITYDELADTFIYQETAY